jgi:hypothetical protein|uniref:Toxin n=1 Tax=Myoviridae sp. ctj9o3 TaxID=2826688 RepID=A0A8S5MBR4_9CAUD|nr:MAG TPA: toxin [Myoviridae sp. ctj9o3]
MKDKELLKLLQKEGWRVDRIKGSHHIMIRENKTLSLPIHGKDVPTGLLNKLLRDAGLK